MVVGSVKRGPFNAIAAYETNTTTVNSGLTINIGPEDPDRYIIIGWSVLNADFPTSMTIGGVTMTQAVQAGFSLVASAIYYAKVPTGTTALLDSSNSSGNDLYVTVYSAKLSSVGTVVTTQAVDATGDATVSVTPTAAGQYIVFAGTNRGGDVPTLTSVSPSGWAALNFTWDAGTRSYYAGSGVSQSTSAHSFVSDVGTSDTHRVSVAVFKPV